MTRRENVASIGMKIPMKALEQQTFILCINFYARETCSSCCSVKNYKIKYSNVFGFVYFVSAIIISSNSLRWDWIEAHKSRHAKNEMINEIII